jgi:hypothetical protein
MSPSSPAFTRRLAATPPVTRVAAITAVVLLVPTTVIILLRVDVPVFGITLSGALLLCVVWLIARTSIGTGTTLVVRGRQRDKTHASRPQ